MGRLEFPSYAMCQAWTLRDLHPSDLMLVQSCRSAHCPGVCCDGPPWGARWPGSHVCRLRTRLGRATKYVHKPTTLPTPVQLWYYSL
jgi:hypothetical protein